ncbi:MAG: arginine--tRNA ligase [Candidatus Pacebacteria bacterium]|nr:arginine--tRNA ligase [Candidatus Paceibacterota bacterium]
MRANVTTLTQQAKERFDKDEEFKKRSHQNVVLLQSGDPKITQAWKYLCDISRSEFEKIYKRLDIKIKEMGESFYNAMIPKVIAELEAKGIVKVDKGAKVIFIPKIKNPLIVQKSDSGYSYDSTDMAAIHYRFQELKCDRIIYVTDSGQQLHFTLVFEAAKLAGWLTPPKNRVDHVGFGLILGKGGKKIKTRSGDAAKLVRTECDRKIDGPAGRGGEAGGGAADREEQGFRGEGGREGGREEGGREEGG